MSRLNQAFYFHLTRVLYTLIHSVSNLQFLKRSWFCDQWRLNFLNEGKYEEEKLQKITGEPKAGVTTYREFSHGCHVHHMVS